MTVTYYAGRPIVQESMPDDAQHRREIARATNNNTNGLNNTSLALTLDGATTVITDPRISVQTAVLLMPTTSAAAALIPSLYTVCTKGTATISGGSAGAVYTAVLVG